MARGRTAPLGAPRPGPPKGGSDRYPGAPGSCEVHSGAGPAGRSYLVAWARRRGRRIFGRFPSSVRFATRCTNAASSGRVGVLRPARVSEPAPPRASTDATKGGAVGPGRPGVQVGVVLAAARAGQAIVKRPGTGARPAAVPGLNGRRLREEPVRRGPSAGSKRWNPLPRYITTVRSFANAPAGFLSLGAPDGGVTDARVRLGVVLAGAAGLSGLAVMSPLVPGPGQPATRRIRILSLISRLPWPSTATPSGAASAAWVAGPPSPEKPYPPLPATV
jgi:hypothetical protein